MSEKKTDKRTIKTRRAIFEGLSELMTKKEIRNITVQELSDKIDIHRVTFYKHFMDIYDVYEQLEKLILSELGLLISQFGEKNTHEAYHAVFRYIKDNQKIAKMVFSPYNPSKLYHKILKMVEGLNRMLWSEKSGTDINDSRVDFAIRYHSNGCLAIIGGWVMSDFAQSEDFVVKMLSGFGGSTQKYLSELLSA